MMILILFVYFPVDGYLGFFQSGVTMNKSAMDMLVYVIGHMSVYLYLWIHLFKKMFSRGIVQGYIPTNNVKELQFFHIFINAWH